MTQAPSVRVLGVRHHSPACARMVEAVLRSLRPRRILIEGPADMNPRLDELRLGHTPPVALFAHCHTESRRWGAWYPFCEHSPEWVALQLGPELGAETFFIDLPGWAVETRENRFADRRGGQDHVAAFERATGEIGYDAVWDALFELPEPDDLQARLHAYFEGLREFESAEPSDERREAFMAEWVGWAAGQSGPTVVVCGGFHAPVLQRAADTARAAPPPCPEPPPDARAATWLVPYSDRRLDAFAGYASGMPSPAWYRWAYAGQPPVQLALAAAAKALRARRQTLSAADLIAAATMAETLARVRGHPSVARVDLMDAVASSWVKDALDAPLPWTTRGPLARGTHPAVVEIVAALSGQARGRLASATPRPPLAAHVEAELERLQLRPPETGARELQVYPGDPDTTEVRHALERLLILGIPGFVRLGPAEQSPQRFELRPDPDFEAGLSEAAGFGATLELAALARLEAQAQETDDAEGLVAILAASVRAGLPRLSARAVEDLRGRMDHIPTVEEVGRALGALIGLLRHARLEAADREAALALVEAGLDRGLWLLEGGGGSGSLDPARIDAVRALRDATLELGAGGQRSVPVFERVAVQAQAPVEVKGAALGALISLDGLTLDEGTRRAVEAIEALAPTQLGDYLVGLLGLARAVLASSEALLACVEEGLLMLDREEWLEALPSLRLAFARLPTRERAAVAERVAERHGGVASGLTRRLERAPMEMARGQALEARALGWATRLGWS